MRSAELSFDLQWAVLGDGSPLVESSIGEAEIRRATGASVAGVIRGDDLEANPGTDFRFRQRDLVAIMGADQARAAFQAMAAPQRTDDGPAAPTAGHAEVGP